MHNLGIVVESGQATARQKRKTAAFPEARLQKIHHTLICSLQVGTVIFPCNAIFQSFKSNKQIDIMMKHDIIYTLFCVFMSGEFDWRLSSVAKNVLQSSLIL